MIKFASLPKFPTVVRPGTSIDVALHAHLLDGTNWSWAGYTPKASLRVGSTVLATVTGTVVNSGGGTFSFSIPSTATAGLPARSFAELQVWADQTAGSDNQQIGNITFQTGEAIP